MSPQFDLAVLLLTFSIVGIAGAIFAVAGELAKIAAAMKERNTIECKKAGINRFTL